MLNNLLVIELIFRDMVGLREIGYADQLKRFKASVLVYRVGISSNF